MCKCIISKSPNGLFKKKISTSRTQDIPPHIPTTSTFHQNKRQYKSKIQSPNNSKKPKTWTLNTYNPNPTSHL